MATWRIAFPRGGDYVLIELGGSVLWPDVLQAYEDYRSRREFRRGMNAIWDLRGAELAISADEVRAAVDIYGKTLDGRGTEHAVAYVVIRDVDYGMLRMWEAYATRLPYETAVFRDFADAEAWVLSRRQPSA